MAQALDQQKQYGELVAKVWADDGFKARLLADAPGTLRAEGWDLPDGTTVDVVDTASGHMTLLLPAKPDELSDEQLDAVSGGGDSFGCFAPSKICIIPR